ncbi:unnamed protein product [Prorocentrum cordatum]|uniref:NET domain-containing protein n=1 Tax=Prorocentrum cordatum TaxID=2364126 RepID=A0ABN9S903_9DINO|nr:unnamed protein product [Polarella glacialis]
MERKGSGMEVGREKQAKRDKPDKPEKQKKHRPNANSDAAPAASDAQPATGLTQEEKLILQGKLDQLDDVQLDRVLEFLGPDVGGGDDGQEVDLDLDQLAPNRQRALIQFVDAELEKVKAAAAAGIQCFVRLAPNPGNIASDIAWANNIVQKLGLPRERLAAAARPSLHPLGLLSGALDGFAYAMHGKLTGAPIFSFTSWNTRAPLQYQGANAMPQLAYLKRLDFTRGVVSLQEVHQNEEQLADFLSKAAFAARLYTSYCEGSVSRCPGHTVPSGASSRRWSAARPSGLPSIVGSSCGLSNTPSDPTCAISDASIMTEGLIEHWAPIFRAKPIDLTVAQQYIARHFPALGISRVEPPSPAPLRRAAQKMHHSEPGLDSIPHSARATTSSGINALADAMIWVMSAVREQLYHIVDAVVMVNGVPAVSWRISFGIVQGCSLSGLIYAAVIACFLFDVQVLLEGDRLGPARARADDIGCVVKHAQALRAVAEAMQVADAIAALSPKLTECMLVPLHAPFSVEVATTVRQALAAAVLFFAKIQIASALVYSGLVLSPAADESSCRLAQSIKVKLRSRLVGSGPLAASRLAANYTAGIAPVLSYVAQHRMMPQWLLKQAVANGRATSHRMLQPRGRISSRFGCKHCPDALEHYLMREEELGYSRLATALGRTIFNVVVMYYAYCSELRSHAPCFLQHFSTVVQHFGQLVILAFAQLSSRDTAAVALDAIPLLRVVDAGTSVSTIARVSSAAGAVLRDQAAEDCGVLRGLPSSLSAADVPGDLLRESAVETSGNFLCNNGYSFSDMDASGARPVFSLVQRFIALRRELINRAMIWLDSGAPSIFYQGGAGNFATWMGWRVDYERLRRREAGDICTAGWRGIVISRERFRRKLDEALRLMMKLSKQHFAMLT